MGELYRISWLKPAFEQSTVLPMTLMDTTTHQEVIQEKPLPPTPLQIRYWQWNREQKLLIDGSRYIQSKNDVSLTSSVIVDDKTLSLPYRPFDGQNTDWLTILFFLVLVVFASVRESFSKYLIHLLQSVFNYSTAVRMYQEKNTSILHGAFRLEIYFYVTAAIFVYQLTGYFGMETSISGIRIFLICLAMVFFYFFIKKMLYRAIGLVIEGTGETGEFLFNMDNFNRVTGLFLFPMVVTIAYFPFYSIDIPILTGIFTVLSFYVLLLGRGIIILLKKQFSIFYLFLYLCTLEFLPLLLIYKLVDI